MTPVHDDRASRRKKRVRKGLFGTKERPRISVFRSNRYIYVQAIDDRERKTICAYSTLQLKKNKEHIQKNKKEESQLIGAKLGELLKQHHITKAVFDRGPYAYKGRVKVLAEALRGAGITI